MAFYMCKYSEEMYDSKGGESAQYVACAVVLPMKLLTFCLGMFAEYQSLDGTSAVVFTEEGSDNLSSYQDA